MKKIAMVSLAALFLVSFISACAHARSFSDLPATAGADVEECLIDFSQKLAAVPPDRLSSVNREQFFALLTPNYASDTTCLRRLAKYPVVVRPAGDSYIITVCEKERRWVLFEDDGATLDVVDHAFVRDGKEVACPPAATN